MKIWIIENVSARTRHIVNADTGQCLCGTEIKRNWALDVDLGGALVEVDLIPHTRISSRVRKISGHDGWICRRCYASAGRIEDTLRDQERKSTGVYGYHIAGDTQLTFHGAPINPGTLCGFSPGVEAIISFEEAQTKPREALCLLCTSEAVSLDWID